MRSRCAAILGTMLLCGLAAGSFAPQSQLQSSSMAELMNSFHSIYVETGTWLSKPEMLQGQLMKHPEFEFWGLSITTNRDADVVLKIDHQPGWFYYTYGMTHRGTGTVLAAGKVTAWDGKVACKRVADEIVKRVAQFRPGPPNKGSGR